MFAKCVDDLQVLELLQKCLVRIKTAKQITLETSLDKHILVVVQRFFWF